MEVQCPDQGSTTGGSIELIVSGSLYNFETNAPEGSSNESSIMKITHIFSLVILPLLVVGGLPGSTVTRGESTIKIGTSDRGTFSRTNGKSRVNSGIRVGEGRFSNTTRQRPTTTSTTTMFPGVFSSSSQSSVGNSSDIINLRVS